MGTSGKTAGYGDIKVISPYEIKTLQELKIVEKANNHAELYLTGIIPEEKKDSCIEMAGIQDKIKVNLIDINDGSIIKTLFNGLVTDIKVKSVRGIYYIELQALSHTFDMDIKLKDRSFQNESMLYMDMIHKVTADYPFVDFIDTSTNSSKLSKFIIQYQETDWQFIKRMASHFSAVLVSYAAADKPKFWLGLPDGAEEINLDEYHYRIKRNLSDYLNTTENYDDSLGEDYFTSYIVESAGFLNVGDKVNYQGQSLVVAQATIKMKNSTLNNEYIIAPSEGIRQNLILNRKLKGVSLEGKVIDRAKDTVKIHLEIDKEQNKAEACWFPYSTFYTAEGNSGWYCMPQLDDHVKLYFQNTREEEALALNSVRKGGQSNPKTADPNTKYFGTNYGKEMKLGGKTIMFTAKDNKEGQMYLKLHEDDGIELKSDKTILLHADTDLTIDSNRNLSITASKAIYLLCGESSVIMDGVTHINSPKVEIDGSVKAPVVVADLPVDHLSNTQPKAKGFWAKLADVADSTYNWLDNKMEQGIDAINQGVDKGFNGLNNALGVDTNSALYKATLGQVEDNIKQSVGIAEGIVHGAADMVTGAVKLVCDTPATAIDIVSDPGKYVQKAENIGKGLANMAEHHEEVLGALESKASEWAKEMEADPYKRGRAVGETAAFIGSFFIGAGEAKVASSAVKAGEVVNALDKTAEAANVLSKTGEAVNAAEKAESVLGKVKTAASKLESNIKDTVEAIQKLKESMKAEVASRLPKLAWVEDAATGIKSPVIFFEKTGGEAEKVAGEVAKGVKEAAKIGEKEAVEGAGEATPVGKPSAATRLKTTKLSSEKIGLDWLPDKYTAVEVEGSVKVAGKEVDVSRRVYQIEIDKNYVPKDPGAGGLTNMELMAKGKSPYVIEDGAESKVELHHLIQKEPGGMVEIAESTHDKYSSTLHGLVEDGNSFRNDPELEKQYNNFKNNYWKMRANES